MEIKNKILLGLIKSQHDKYARRIIAFTPQYFGNEMILINYQRKNIKRIYKVFVTVDAYLQYEKQLIVLEMKSEIQSIIDE